GEGAAGRAAPGHGGAGEAPRPGRGVQGPPRLRAGGSPPAVSAPASLLYNAVSGVTVPREGTVNVDILRAAVAVRDQRPTRPGHLAPGTEFGKRPQRDDPRRRDVDRKVQTDRQGILPARHSHAPHPPLRDRGPVLRPEAEAAGEEQAGRPVIEEGIF